MHVFYKNRSRQKKAVVNLVAFKPFAPKKGPLSNSLNRSRQKKAVVELVAFRKGIVIDKKP